MIETISADTLQCGEGPMWDGDLLKLFWTDAMGETIYAYDHSSTRTSKIHEGRQAGSIALHADGGLVLGTGDGFYVWSEKDGVKAVAEHCDGRAIEHINDIIADPRGRVFGGQECYQEDKDYERGYLYRLDPEYAPACSKRVVSEQRLGNFRDHTTVEIASVVSRLVRGAW